MKHSEKYSSFYRLRVNPWVSMFIAFLILLVISPLIAQGLFALYPSVSAGDHPLFISARLLLPRGQNNFSYGTLTHSGRPSQTIHLPS